MAGLTTLKTNLRDQLEEIPLKVFPYVPAQITPPVVVMGSGDPYVTDGDTFGNAEFKAHLELFLIVPQKANDVMTAELDTMLEKVIDVLVDWDIDNVSAPYFATANDSQYLTCRLDISKLFTLEV